MANVDLYNMFNASPIARLEHDVRNGLAAAAADPAGTLAEVRQCSVDF